MKLRFLKKSDVSLFALLVISVFSLSRCSETALRSAIYNNPYEGTSSRTPQAPSPGPSSGSGLVQADKDSSEYSEISRDDMLFPTPETDIDFGITFNNEKLLDPNAPMELLIKKPQLFVEEIFGLSTSSISESLRFSALLEVNSIAIYEDQGEHHFEGRLTITVYEGDNRLRRIFKSVGPVVYARAQNLDIMQADFLADTPRGKLRLSLELSRHAASNDQERLLHPWQGSLFQGITSGSRARIGRLQGFDRAL